MKITFIAFHDILEERIDKVFKKLEIDYYTQWEEVKGKGHCTDAHLGTRVFPGYNIVRMVAFENETVLEALCEDLKELNSKVVKCDDKVRLFQLPLEKII